MIKLTLDRLNETYSGKLIRCGVPFAQGQVTQAQQLQVWQNGTPLITQAQITSRWPDNSVRWAAISAYALTELRPDNELTLAINKEPVTQKALWQQQDYAEFFSLQNAEIRYQICKKTATVKVFHTQAPLQHAWETSFVLENKSNTAMQATVTNVVWLTEQNAYFPTIKISGYWDNKNKILFDIQLDFYPDGLIRTQYTLHNSGRAQHPGGMWDLGDPGSFLFKKLQLTIAGNTQEWSLQAHVSEPVITHSSQPLTLQQHSSGGDNWQSQNHINAEGKIPLLHCGYTINNNLNTGLQKRAEPLVSAKNALIAGIAVPHFWQKFPQAIDVSAKGITLELFMDNQEHKHELQGGEKSTREVWLQFKSAIDTEQAESAALRWVYQPAHIILPAQYIADCAVLPWFSVTEQDSMSTCLVSPAEFLAKREIIDEYGWRNFGDIFADHETLYQAENEPLYISHYNNQYDAIYGFCRQFLLTGDSRWFVLMDDLAKHVTDIDIYDTDDDRDEYNHGLFWHTDHYLPAKTATHRTYSVLNNTATTHTSGGGPGPEHCYTTGLLYHYLITGNLQSKTAVLKLAQWMVNTHEGSGGLLEQLFFIKELEIPKLKSLLQGKILAINDYPFTRGSANYINTLLDAYTLEPQKDWLTRAENVIRATFHPSDPIAARNLLNAETGWHYLVLLGSLVNFIKVKTENQSFDSHYTYALSCFRHYTRWMLEHEQPFLDNPTQLEYPNHTWVAQDIRKAMLLYVASTLDPELSKAYEQRAAVFMHYVLEKLHHSPERNLARVQIILLLNHGPHLCHQFNLQHQYNETILQNTRRAAVLTKSAILRKISYRLCKGLLSFRPTKERDWLRVRLNKSG